MAFDQLHGDALRELDALKRHLAEQIETMYGVLENGSWVLIPDPRLRELVRRHVADAVSVLAAEIGADGVEAAARKISTAVLPLRVEDV